MTTRTIYTALGVEEYVGAWPFRAFTSKKAATAFVERCNAHGRFTRSYPTLDLPEPEFAAEEKKWMRAKRRFDAAHPAGPDHADYHEYRVGRLILVDSEQQNGKRAT